jgi:hypothetical protein
MIDTKQLATAGGDHENAGTPPHTHPMPGRGRWTDVLPHLWPPALGIAVAAVSVFDLEGGLEFAALTVLMALVYLGAAALDRRWSAWVVLLAGLSLTIFDLSIAGIHPAVILFLAAPVFLVLGVVRGQLATPGGLPLQTVGMIAFGAAALVALAVNPDLGGKLVGIAILGHGVWDVYHYRKDRVVPRSYAAFCAVLDLLLGTAILVMA